MSTLKNNIGADGPEPTSAYEEMPPYLLGVYREQVTIAKRKLERLERFLLTELERPADDRDPSDIDWNVERSQRAKILDRWARETKGIIRELTRLLNDVRDDQAILNEYVLERSGKTFR